MYRFLVKVNRHLKIAIPDDCKLMTWFAANVN